MKKSIELDNLLKNIVAFPGYSLDHCCISVWCSQSNPKKRHRGTYSWNRHGACQGKNISQVREHELSMRVKVKLTCCLSSKLKDLRT